MTTTQANPESSPSTPRESTPPASKNSRRRAILWTGIAACAAAAATTRFAFAHDRPAHRLGFEDQRLQRWNKDLLFSTQFSRMLEEETTSERVCTLVRQCSQCSSTERKTYSACLDHAKAERYECSVIKGGERTITSEMKGCGKSQTEEQFSMVWLELSCAVIGFFALVQVRKQKMISASLFDQRKQRGRMAKSPRDLDEEEMELIPVRQDSLHLSISESSSNPLEII